MNTKTKASPLRFQELQRFPSNKMRLVEATATVILGRTAAYTGRMLNYSWVLKDSQLDLRPPKFDFGPLPVAPLAIPGKTELI